MGDDLRARLYLPLLTAHGAWRWVILAMALAATAVAWRAWLGGSSGPEFRSRAAKLFVLAADIQLTLGLSLYLFVSPVMRGVFAAAPADSEAHYFAYAHAGAMLGVVVLAHVGKVASANAASARDGGRIAPSCSPLRSQYCCSPCRGGDRCCASDPKRCNP